MNDILHANIFFFVTTVVVVVLGVLAIVALYYVLGILKNIRDISNRQNYTPVCDAHFHFGFPTTRPKRMSPAATRASVPQGIGVGAVAATALSATS